jgi:hypothetical protein
MGGTALADAISFFRRPAPLFLFGPNTSSPEAHPRKTTEGSSPLACASGWCGLSLDGLQGDLVMISSSRVWIIFAIALAAILAQVDLVSSQNLNVGGKSQSNQSAGMN